MVLISGQYCSDVAHVSQSLDVNRPLHIQAKIGNAVTLLKICYKSQNVGSTKQNNPGTTFVVKVKKKKKKKKKLLKLGVNKSCKSATH